MAGLVDMKGMTSDDCSPRSPSDYPYGLKLYLNDKILDALGMDPMPEVGTEMTLTAKVIVVNRSEELENDNDSMGLQITAMAVGSEEKKPAASEALYGGKA